MTKNERIEQLERKVAELEYGRLAQQSSWPVVNIPSVWINPPCLVCGTFGWHACLGRQFTTVSDSTGNITYIKGQGL